MSQISMPFTRSASVHPRFIFISTKAEAIHIKFNSLSSFFKSGLFSYPSFRKQTHVPPPIIVTMTAELCQPKLLDKGGIKVGLLLLVVCLLLFRISITLIILRNGIAKETMISCECVACYKYQWSCSKWLWFRVSSSIYSWLSFPSLRIKWSEISVSEHVGQTGDENGRNM